MEVICVIDDHDRSGSNGASEVRSRRKLLGLFRPPKPLSEMTEEEREAWVDACAATISERLEAELGDPDTNAGAS
jgi:hypothetical protein